MDQERSRRRLAAIMFTDIVGYTALMAESEERGRRARGRHREVVRPLVAEHQGESIEARGDESLSTFSSALDAVHCALALQDVLEFDPDLSLHIGIHLGDIVLEEGEASGDGINIASRICALSAGGTVCVSGEVYQAVRNRPELDAVSLGDHDLKNVGRPVAVFELGRPGTVFPQRGATRGRSARARGSLLAAAALALAMIAWRMLLAAPSPASIRSLAVLPLANLSADPDHEYFADGLTDALIGDLARLGAFRVISRTSVMRYKGERMPLDVIARELDVDAVVEGTIARDGSSVRINIQLIDARSDDHLWSESYERRLTSVLTLQREVARAVARQVERTVEAATQTAPVLTGLRQLVGNEAVRGRLRDIVPRPEFSAPQRIDPRAHDAYLKGQYQSNTNTREGVLRAIEHFEEAVRIAPDYPLAYVGLSRAYSSRLLLEGGAFPQDSSLRAKAAAQRALELDDRLGEAHAAVAWVLFRDEWDWTGAQREFERASELGLDSPDSLVEHALYLSATGEHERALALAERAVALSPLDLAARTELGRTRFLARRYEQALDELRTVVELDPSFARAYLWLGWTYSALGREQDHIEAWLNWLVLSEAPVGMLDAWKVGHEAGDVRLAFRRLAEEMSRRETPDSTGRGGVHRAYAILGDADRAFQWIQHDLDARAFSLVFAAVDPVLDSLRSDPRFGELLRKVGVPQGQKS